MAAPDLVNLCRCPDRVIQGVVRSGRFIGCTESGQSGANQGIPGFACNPDLDHADRGAKPVQDVQMATLAVKNGGGSVCRQDR